MRGVSRGCHELLFARCYVCVCFHVLHENERGEMSAFHIVSKSFTFCKSQLRFNSVAQAHRKKLCQRLSLPKTIKDILQKPKDEDNLEKFEELRRAILLEIEGDEHVFINEDEANEIANAIEKSEKIDEVGEDCKLPIGCRVQVEGKTKKEVVAEVRGLGNDWLRVLMRPFGTCREEASYPVRRRLGAR